MRMPLTASASIYLLVSFSLERISFSPQASLALQYAGRLSYLYIVLSFLLGYHAL